MFILFIYFELLNFWIFSHSEHHVLQGGLWLGWSFQFCTLMEPGSWRNRVWHVPAAWATWSRLWQLVNSIERDPEQFVGVSIIGHAFRRVVRWRTQLPSWRLRPSLGLFRLQSPSARKDCAQWSSSRIAWTPCSCKWYISWTLRVLDMLTTLSAWSPWSSPLSLAGSHAWLVATNGSSRVVFFVHL